jgi:hypothetical protein
VIAGVSVNATAEVSAWDWRGEGAVDVLSVGVLYRF